MATYSSFMALNIKDPETDRLARELAERTGASITEALRNALAHELDRTPPRRHSTEDRRARIQAIIERGRARPMRDMRKDEEILGYDEDGLPA